MSKGGRRCNLGHSAGQVVSMVGLNGVALGVLGMGHGGVEGWDTR